MPDAVLNRARRHAARFLSASARPGGELDTSILMVREQRTLELVAIAPGSALLGYFVMGTLNVCERRVNVAKFLPELAFAAFALVYALFRARQKSTTIGLVPLAGVLFGTAAGYVAP